MLSLQFPWRGANTRWQPKQIVHKHWPSSGRERWRVGHVDALQPDDESPFALGNLRSGEARLAVDANLFRAAAEPHAPAGAPLADTPTTVGMCAVWCLLSTGFA